jgi:K+-sensing histidine kinase KdpD
LRNIHTLIPTRLDVAISVCIAVVVLWTDYVTGKDIQFPILYVLPIGIAAWRNRKILAYAMSIVLPFVRVVFHIPWHATQSLPLAIVNAMITVASLVLYAYLVDRKALQTRKLENRVRTLEGIIPMCAWCKKIRNEKGDYEQIEKYVTEHFDAKFSHGLCPECAKKLYPGYMKDERT